MSVSPPVHAHGGTSDGDRQSTNSPYFPRISGANTIARPSPLHTTIDDDAFPTVKLQAKMVKQTPLPYQTQEFKPCIVLKKFEPSVRLSDSFMTGVQGDDGLGEFKKKRTVILHTDRYSRHGQLKLESDSQKIRLAQEGQMLEDARSRMRLREALAHRARHDLHLGGNPVAPDLSGEADEIRSLAAAAAASSGGGGGGGRKSDKRRLRKPQKRSTDKQHAQLGFIPEDVEDGSPGRRGGHGQLVSHSSAPSIPALHLGAQLHRGLGAGPHQASFVSRSEFEALTALIGEQQPEPFGCGLEKVKLDGSRAVFNRRSDILAELTRLKAIVLPDFAKDLYVGRGIRLPESHGLNHPKRMINAGDDPIMDALMRRAQQPTRIIDEAGNILISAGSNASSQQQQKPRDNKQVFAADVTVKSKLAENQSAEPPPEPIAEESAADAGAPTETGEPEPPVPLPEPYLGLPTEWGQREDAAAEGDPGPAEQLKQLHLPASIADYLLAILAASGHARASSLTLELGRLIGQRLLASGGGVADGSTSGGLIGWLRRGLDLFHDVDREVKGSVSLAAFFDILSSMRGQPVEDSEAAQIRDAYGLSGDSVSKLAFLAVLPLLQVILNRKA